MTTDLITDLPEAGDLLMPDGVGGPLLPGAVAPKVFTWLVELHGIGTVPGVRWPAASWSDQGTAAGELAGARFWRAHRCRRWRPRLMILNRRMEVAPCRCSK